MDKYRYITEMERDEDGVLVGNCERCGLDGVDVEEHINSEKHINSMSKKSNIHSYESFHKQDRGSRIRQYEADEAEKKPVVMKIRDIILNNLVAVQDMGGRKQVLGKGLTFDDYINFSRYLVGKYSDFDKEIDGDAEWQDFATNHYSEYTKKG